MIHFMVFFLALMGFGTLLMAMPRHQSEWLGRKLDMRLSFGLRAAGFALLFVAAIVGVAAFGIGYGLVAWCGWLTGAAMLWVGANTMKARRRP